MANRHDAHIHVKPASRPASQPAIHPCAYIAEVSSPIPTKSEQRHDKSSVRKPVQSPEILWSGDYYVRIWAFGLKDKGGGN